ncbi:DMT family transporter [Curvibacter sp. APW13]|uniref:DMT family transporter n=1 Tax=Curvibacter sp. APW13 TaxID=3077236 RepID=UPI0028DF01F2|nr:DMT family transporter [Curvibacter sp. APW13]MDT8990961.1 DMT family transporter [Curvibacter sp. APW13]
MTDSKASSPRTWAVDFVLLAAIWGASFLFMRTATREFGVFATAGLRTLIAAAFLLPLVALRGQVAAMRQFGVRTMAIGVMNSAIPFACFSFALLSISTGLSAILNATVPLFGALVAWAWLGDKPSRTRLAGLAIGFAGVCALAWKKASFTPDASGLSSGWAVLACLTATLCYGISGSLAKKNLGGVPSLVSSAGSQLGATLALAPLLVWYWPTTTPGLQAWAAIAALGLLCTGLAYVLYFRLIERAGPARALSVTFAIPVFAVAYGVVLLGETVTLWMLGCAAVIVLGTALSSGLIGSPRR